MIKMGLDFLTVIVLILFMESQSEVLKVVGPNDLIAVAGEDVVLPCYIQPDTSAVDMRIEWFRLDVKDTVVHLYNQKKDVIENQAESYRGRTALFKDELQNGNASLKLSAVRVSDEGDYKCLIEARGWYDDITVHVTVEGILGTPPVITVDSFDHLGINLMCASRGWNPEPAVLWMDKRGADLSAEATETHRDTEGFSVKRRLTVYDGDSNIFYCRLQQKHHMLQTEVIIDSKVFHAWKVVVITLSVTSILTAGLAAIFIFFLILLCCSM